MLRTKDFTPAQLDRFRARQAEVYDLFQQVIPTLEPGMTEKQVTTVLHRALIAKGMKQYFHGPVALFGDRSAYPGDFGQTEALPTQRRLRNNEMVILDAAPVLDGYAVDCSFAFPFGEVPDFERVDRELERLRGRIFDLAKTGMTMQKIAWTVDDEIRQAGFANCHKKHIAMVLGHRLGLIDDPFLARQRIWGLSPRLAWWFVSGTGLAALGLHRITPNWNHTKVSDCPVQPGLWAVEPHLAIGPVGAKFEEILVVTDDNMFWLDNDLPHHRRWKARAAAAAPAAG